MAAFEISNRAIASLNSGTNMEIEDAVAALHPPYDPVTCPDGLISLAGATQSLTQDMIRKYTEEFAKNHDLQDSTKYGGFTGPKELQVAVAGFINNHFKPAHPVDSECILATNGVSSLVEQVGFNLCDAGEGIMLMTPTYMMFPLNLMTRAGIKVVTVATDDLKDFDAFTAPHAIQLIEKLEIAYRKAQQQGIRVRALLVCNPCNPVGRSYSHTTLVEIARFCGRYQMHLLADEIYALSTFESPDNAEMDRFSSVLSIPDEPERGVFGSNIHAMYGASKDWACGGLRLGLLTTRNPLLWKTCRKLSLSTWPATFSTSLFIDLLSDEKKVQDYIDTYQARLQESYICTSKLLRAHDIPFKPANSGMFIFIELTRWLDYFEGSLPRKEEKLCWYLVKAGVFLSQGRFSLSTIPGCFRFVYARDPQIVAIAISRMSEALAQLEKQGNIQRVLSDTRSAESSESEVVKLDKCDTEGVKGDKGNRLSRSLKRLSGFFCK